MSIFSHPVRSRSEVIACGMTPIFLRTRVGWRAMSSPATRASPELGGSSVVSIRTSVVLPAPLGPSSPNTSPRSTSSVTPLTAVKLPKRLQRSLVVIAAEVGSIVTPRERYFRCHPGFQFAIGLQHLYLHVKCADVLAAAPHVALGREVSLLPDRHHASTEGHRRVGRQLDGGGLADVNRSEVGLLHIDARPDGRQVVHREDRSSGRDPFTDLQRLVGDHAIDRRNDRGIGELILEK